MIVSPLGRASRLAAGLCALALLPAVAAFAWTSSKVQYDVSGRLFYPADEQGNRIPDFSHAGYKGGGVPLPTVPVVLTISPVDGDDTASIQAAVDAVGAMPVLADGYRGAVLLTAGVYDVAGTIRMNKSGVVLSGVGDGDDPASNTILRRTGTSQAHVIKAGGGSDDSFRSEIAGTRRNITTQRVQVGAQTFTVDDATPYMVGDNIVVTHPSTAAWIAAVESGGVTDSNKWTPGSKDIRYHRYITAISGNTIAIDAPIFNHLDRGIAQSYIYKYDRTGVQTNFGIEDLQVDIVTAGPTSETHCEDAIEFNEVEDSWIRDCTMKHFWHAGVQFAGSTRSTAERCRAIDPHSVITGGRRYNFATYHSQLILFRDCFANEARHGFVANGTQVDSGNVVLNSTLDRNRTFSEGHRHWSTGLLFDNLKATNRVSSDTWGFYNRGNFGTGHGWAVAHGVIWNCDASGGKTLVQQPPTAQNYAIGCFGNVSVSGPFAGLPGYREGTNTPGLQPQSLYLEQLSQRQTMPAAPDLAAPSAPTLSSGAIGGTSVALSWTAAMDNVGVVGYDVFHGTTFLGFTSGTSFNAINLESSTTYAFSVYAKDAAGNAAQSNVVSATTTGVPVTPPSRFEAEDLVWVASGANASIANETFASGGQFASNFKYVSFGADGVPPPPNGEFIDFTIPEIPAGTYNLLMRFKSHPANRGILRLSVDGVDLGNTVNERSSPATFREVDFGVVRFPTAGTHVVRLSVTGKDSTSTAFTLTADVFTFRPDTKAPVVAALADVTIEATGPDGAVATFTGTATDDKDGAVPVTFTPASGSVFALGTTIVVGTAMDFAGNLGTNSFEVNVLDTTAPTLSLPASQIIEATGPDGAVAQFAATASDIVDTEVAVAFSHSTGAFFPLGTTVVTATAADETENIATGTFSITVVDTTAPAIPSLPDLTIEAANAQGAIATYGATAADAVSGSIPVSFDIPSGSVFAIGATLVTGTVQDAAGNVSNGSFIVTVRDTTAPVITGLKPSKTELWSPNHKMVPITITGVATDAVDSEPTLRIVSVTSDEPVNEPGSCQPEVDWEITGALTLNLRAERLGNGDGRVYTITVESRDSFGNATTQTVTVKVPKSRGRR